MEFQNLITLIESVSASGLTELKYEENGVKIKLSKKERKVQTIQVSEALTSETAALTAGRNEKDIQSTGTGKENVNEENVPAGKVVASPLVGTLCSTCGRCGSICTNRRYGEKRTDAGDRRSDETDE